MAVVQYPLDEIGKVVLDASGNGTVRLGPSSNRMTWNVTNAAVAVSTAVKEPTANLYLNTTASKLAGTNTGSNDSTALDVTVRNGFVMCVWIGGDAGATATLTLQGSQHKDA